MIMNKRRGSINYILQHPVHVSAIDRPFTKRASGFFLSLNELGSRDEMVLSQKRVQKRQSKVHES